MKKIKSRTIDVGRLRFTFIHDEVLFIYNGKKRIYMKTYKKHRSVLGKKIAIAFSIVLTITLVLGVMLSAFPTPQKDDVFEKDEKKKNDLLLSTTTDFTEDKKKSALKISKYTVRRGDTLSTIAKKFGVSIDTICGSNNLRSYNLIHVGKKLTIPNKDGMLIKMGKKKNVINIARKYKVSLKKILDQNDLKNPDFIPLNKVLFIPDAKPQNIIVGFMWPTRSRTITSSYGWRRNPFNRRRREFHRGMDIKAHYAWIRSSKYGKVTFTGWLGGYGKAVIVAHPGGWKTLYAHLSRIIVRRGQYVKQGQYVARSGNTGRSTGPHLHFEIIKRGRHKNPYSYLRRNRWKRW